MHMQLVKEVHQATFTRKITVGTTKNYGPRAGNLILDS
jgi:hypothetical protein